MNFSALNGATIDSVLSSCANQVVLKTTNGFIYLIDAEVSNGIPVMSISRRKETLSKLPKAGQLAIPRKKKD